MKFFAPLLISLALSFSVCSQNIVFVKDSIMDAYMRSGFANKQFRNKPDPENGIKNGKWEGYEVEKIYTVVADGNDGHYVSGNFLVYAKGKYKDNARVGLWTFWVLEDKTFNKIKNREVIYVDGKLDGEEDFFYPDGKVASRVEFKDDTVIGTETDYFPDGKIAYTIQYIKQIPQSNLSYTMKRFYHSGVLRAQKNIVQDSLDGPYFTYYENGKIQQSSFFILGSPDSVYKYFYPNGQLWTEKHYKKGLLMNVICNYSQDGVARDKGTLADGNGTVILYDQDGKVYDVQYVEKGRIVKEDMKTKTDPFGPKK